MCDFVWYVVGAHGVVLDLSQRKFEIIVKFVKVLKLRVAESYLTARVLAPFQWNNWSACMEFSNQYFGRNRLTDDSKKDNYRPKLQTRQKDQTTKKWLQCLL